MITLVIRTEIAVFIHRRGILHWRVINRIVSTQKFIRYREQIYSSSPSVRPRSANHHAILRGQQTAGPSLAIAELFVCSEKNWDSNFAIINWNLKYYKWIKIWKQYYLFVGFPEHGFFKSSYFKSCERM